MAIKSYILQTDVLAPYVTATGIPHRPQKINAKKFSRGQIVQGEMKHANNQPAFVLVGGVLVIPANAVKEVVSKDVEVNSNAEGTETKKETEKSSIISHSNPKVKYMDAAILGAVVGALAVYGAEKQGWIQVPENKNRVYGAIAGTLLACYIVYRVNSNKPKKKVKTEE